MLDSYPALKGLVTQLDTFLQRRYPDFFSLNASHPYLAPKRFKVIHDPIWGTNRFTWRELALIDSPLFQRLRRIHQVGLVHQIYPSAHHTRFEHSLGVCTVAAKVFDALADNSLPELNRIISEVYPGQQFNEVMLRLKQELRLAALFHDIGHSLYSHTSELVYQDLQLLKEAANELTQIVGKEKGAGEVISFTLSQTPCIRRLFDRAAERLKPADNDRIGEIDFVNVSLIIVGRSRHPSLQFLGDIVSSGLDADKLDYLLRDAVSAGLPLRYDLERYLYAVRIKDESLADGSGELEALYKSIGSDPKRKPAAPPLILFPHYTTYRLRLPQGMSTFEQIIICKMMLFGYIYHHPKVRSAEGMLARVLQRLVDQWREEEKSDGSILEQFLDLTDPAIEGPLFRGSRDVHIRNYCDRIANRLLAREVYRLGGSIASGQNGAKLKDFVSDLQDKTKREPRKKELETAIGEEILKIDGSLGNSAEEALLTTGVWVDVPKPPKFEDTETLVGATAQDPGIAFSQVFPISHWTQAYTSHRYFVRVFAFSEYWEVTNKAAQAAMKRVLNIEDESFFLSIRRTRKK